jgi:acyl-CoA dehydrogenase
VDFSPDPDHEAIVEAVDRVCSAFDDTYWADCDRDHRFPWEF